MRALILASAALALAACAAPAEPSHTEPEAVDLAVDGRVIAETQCAACHAVGVSDESPIAEAPALRTVLARYNADALEEELTEGIQVNHQMPDFQFNPQGAHALIAYLQSIQVAEGGT